MSNCGFKNLHEILINGGVEKCALDEKRPNGGE